MALEGVAVFYMAARRECRRESFSVKETMITSGEVVHDDDLLLTQAAFKKRKKEESDAESADADQQFDTLLEQHGTQWTHSSGKNRVRIERLRS